MRYLAAHGLFYIFTFPLYIFAQVEELCQVLYATIS